MGQTCVMFVCVCLNSIMTRFPPTRLVLHVSSSVVFTPSDLPSKTVTGTIAIQVSDANDHCPTLCTTSTKLCSDQRSVVITGCDEDVHPNSDPFTFRVIPEGTRGSWEVEVINGKVH